MIRFLRIIGLLSICSPVAAEVDIQEIVSPGGINAWLVQEESIPFVALEIRFKGGTSLDEPGKRGAVNLMTALLEEGAGDIDAREFARRSEELAASYAFGAGADFLRVSARFLSENQDHAIELLRMALREPRFEEPAIERVRAQVITSINASAKSPNSIAGNTFYAEAYGVHPYGTNDSGSLESVAGLRRADLVEAYRSAFSRDRLFVAAAGDISAQELGNILDNLFAGLPEKGPNLPDQTINKLGTGVRVVEFETPQSVAIFGHQGIDRHDDDFFAAFILNHILGGSNFGARLNQEVREKRGLTYGISSHHSSREYGDLYVGQVASSNGQIAEAISVIREVWSDVAENGVSQEELDHAKTFLTGAYPLRFDGNARIASILVGMQVTGLEPEYIRSRNEKVLAVTLEDIRRVARRILRPDDLYFVVVGKPEGL